MADTLVRLVDENTVVVIEGNDILTGLTVRAETAADNAEASEDAAAASAAAAASSAIAADNSADAADLSEAAAASALAGVLAELASVSITTATMNAANRTALQALDHTLGLPAILLQDGGIFVPTAGNFTTQVAADTPFQAKYVAWSTGAANGAWIRIDPLWWTPEMAQAAGDGVADDAPEINYLLTLGNVRCTTGKIHGVATSVLIPSNRTLELNGATIKMLSGFTNQTISGFTVNACIASVETAGVKVLGPGLVDGNKVGMGGGLGARKNGVAFYNSQGFLAEGYIVQNTTGYANWAQGKGTTKPSGVFRRIDVYNADSHFEQMQGRDITVEDCRSFDGDGDIACDGWLYVFYNDSGCENIHYVRHYGKGAVTSAVHIVSEAEIHRNITVTDCRFEVEGTGMALRTEGPAGVQGLRISNSELNTEGTISVAVTAVGDLSVDHSRIAGAQHCVQISATKGEITACTMVCTPPSGSVALPVSNPLAGDTDSQVHIRGGKIDVTGDAGVYYTSGEGIRLSEDTILSFNGAIDGPIFPATAGTVSVPSGYIVHHHQNRTIQLVPALSQTVTLPKHATMPWPIGTKLRISVPVSLVGGYTKAIVAETGATYTGPASISAFGFVDAVKTGTNAWVAAGTGA